MDFFYLEMDEDQLEMDFTQSGEKYPRRGKRKKYLWCNFLIVFWRRFDG